MEPVWRVLIFLAPLCPICQNMTFDLRQLEKDFAGESVEFVGVFPNASTTEAQIATFQQTYPDSFYAAKAEAEVTPTRTALREAMQKIAALGDAGDLYAKHQLIEESEKLYAKMPEFDAANEQWAAEAKDPAVKQALTAGAAYSDIFEDAEALGVKLEESLKKNKRISKKDKRDKADAKAMSKFQKGLVSLGKKLERIAKRYSGTYYGDAASRSYRSFVDSGEQVLQDLR